MERVRDDLIYLKNSSFHRLARGLGFVSFQLPPHIASVNQPTVTKVTDV